MGNSKISAASPIKDDSELDEYSTPIQNDRTKNKPKNQVTLTAEQLAIYKNTKSLLEKNPDLLRSKISEEMIEMNDYGECSSLTQHTLNDKNATRGTNNKGRVGARGARGSSRGTGSNQKKNQL